MNKSERPSNESTNPCGFAATATNARSPVLCFSAFVLCEGLTPGGVRIGSFVQQSGRRWVLKALLAGAMALVLSSCASTSTGSRVPFPRDTVRSVVVTSPEVGFVYVENGNPINPPPGRSGQVGAALAAVLSARLNAMGVQAISGRAGGGNILSSRLTVHEGAGGTWDPNSGAITANSSRLELNLELTSGSPGRVLWEQHALLRAPLDRSCSRLAKLADVTFGK